MLGNTEITVAELLLGIVREDKPLAMRLGLGGVDAIRNEIEALAPPKGERQRIATSVDMPLSNESKRALAYAAEEAERLLHKHIDSTHLVLGLLRQEDTLAAKLLGKHGIELEAYRGVVRQESPERGQALVRPTKEHERPIVAPLAASLEPAISNLQSLVYDAAARLGGFTDAEGDQRLKRRAWTRKEAIGHLMDWAIVHQQWVTRALLEPRVQGVGYPDEASVAVQGYAALPWLEVVNLWASFNGLLIHVLLRVPEEKLSVPCRMGIAEPLPLSKLIEAYVKHCEDIAAQVLAKLD